MFVHSVPENAGSSNPDYAWQSRARAGASYSNLGKRAFFLDDMPCFSWLSSGLGEILMEESSLTLGIGSFH